MRNVYANGLSAAAGARAGWWCSVLRGLMGAALVAAAAVQAQTFPEKSVSLIVPFSPGSITDNIARMVTVRLGERLKQPVVIETRTGAGGLVAMKALQAARPDGYTIGLIPSASTVQPWTIKDYPIDVRKDVQLLTMMYAGPLVLVVPPTLPANNVSEFMAWVKANPTKAFYGSSGAGTTTHLAVELLKQDAAIPLTHIPFKGSSDVYTSMGGGHVMAYFDLYGTAKNMVDAGRAKIIGVASLNRMSVMPNVPAVAETLPGFEVTGWVAFALPNGTPKPIVDKLSSELQAVLRDPEFQQRLKAMGVEPGGNSSAEVAQYVAAEMAKWGRVTRGAGVKPE